MLCLLCFALPSSMQAGVMMLFRVSYKPDLDMFLS